MAYQRKCENWLSSFGKWTLPRCESPETFVFWSGLFILSSALRRQVKIGTEYLGSWECPPHLFIVLVGEAGKVRKTTAAGFGIELLEEIPFLKKGPAVATQASLLTSLVESPDNSIYLVSEEFHDLIMKSKDDMFGFLTSMFDGRRHYEATTISRGAELATRPCINLFAATTPQWIAGNMPESVIGGGFASRVIFILEKKVRQRRMYYRKIIDPDEMKSLRADLLSDLYHIAETLEGNFQLTEEAEEFMENWYQENAEGDDGNYKLAGYFQRRPAHIHKVAMLLRIAKSDELLIRKEDFENAIELMKQIEVNLPQVFAGIGKNPYTFDIDRILDHIRENEPVTHAGLLAHFRSAAEPRRLEELINGLVTMEEIIQFTRDNEVFYASNDYIINTNNKPRFDPNDINTWNY